MLRNDRVYSHTTLRVVAATFTSLFSMKGLEFSWQSQRSILTHGRDWRVWSKTG